MDLQAYLTFNGNCEEALNFYKRSLNGEIQSISYFDSSPMEVPPDYKKKVLHSNFKWGNFGFMASDSMPDQCLTVGNNISLSLGFDKLDEMELAFSNLSSGGQITMPLQDTFWGARFGMLIDKFGINWMLNYETKK